MDFQRQHELFDPNQHQSPVTIVGAGGIGSPTAVALAKLGLKELRLIDDDLVAPENLPSQLFQTSSLGKPKVEAVADLVRAVSDTSPSVRVGRFNGVDPVDGIVISAVDSMESRRAIWSRVKYNAAVSLFIDGRMGGTVLRVYSVRPCNPDDVQRYESTLYESKDTAPLPCGARAIIFTGLAIAALITRNATRWLIAGECEFEVVADLGRNLQVFVA